MRIGTLALAASAMLFVTATASADQGADAGDLVAGRQAGMRLTGAVMASMKGVIDRGEDVKGQTNAAKALAGWAKAIPGLFPAGSDGGSGALPTVWSDTPGFVARADAYADAASKLAAAASENDKAAFATAWGEVRATCGACHDSYKKP